MTKRWHFIVYFNCHSEEEYNDDEESYALHLRSFSPSLAGQVFVQDDTIHDNIFLTFTSNILQLNCYDIFIFYTVYRNVIIDIRITIILSTYMNQSNLMIIQNFVILSFIISYLVCDQEWILHIIIFRSPILWNQVNSIP